jgi:hypothetical protein
MKKSIHDRTGHLDSSVLRCPPYEVFLHSRICVPHLKIPPGEIRGTPPPLTEAEVDAQIAACAHPPGTLLPIGAGYAVILVAGLYMTAGKLEIRADP